MKKILAALLVLALVAPAMADVAITASDAGSQRLQISFSGPANAVRGIALTLTVTNGTVSSFISSSFNTFIDYAYSNSGYTIGTGHPFALATAPGVVTPPITAGTPFAVSVGYLDQAGTKLGLTSGSVALIQLSGIPDNQSATVAISANAARGGAAVGDSLGTVTVQSSQTVAGPVVVLETVSTPTTPTVLGNKFYATQLLPVSTGGSTCSLGHSVQYRFDWGDGTTSAWQTVGTLKVNKSYATAGNTYTIRAQARCATNTTVESAWSAGFTHTVSSQCQMYNLTKRINGATDNTLNVSDLNLFVGYVNANRSVSSVFAVLVTHPNYNARYNFDATTAINVSDLNGMVGFVNAARISSAVFARSCPATP